MAIAFSERYAVKGHKWIDVSTSGYHTAILLPEGYDEKKLHDAMDYTYKLLCGSCYMQMVIADNFLIKSKDILVSRKLFKFSIKKNFMAIQGNIRDTMEVYEEYMDDIYYDEYSSVLYDKVSIYIEKLRKFIENKLRNLGVCNAYDSSIVIIIQNLTQTIGDTFNDVMNKVKEHYDIDLSQAYAKYRPKMAFSKADCLLYDIMHKHADIFRDNIVKNKKVIELWSEIIKGIYDQKNQIEARKAAYYNMPKEQQDFYILREDGFLELKEGVKVYRKET